MLNFDNTRFSPRRTLLQQISNNRFQIIDGNWKEWKKCPPLHHLWLRNVLSYSLVLSEYTQDWVTHIFNSGYMWHTTRMRIFWKVKEAARSSSHCTGRLSRFLIGNTRGQWTFVCTRSSRSPSASSYNCDTKAVVAQWWEHSPSTNVAWGRFPASASYVGWVCWFSTLLWEVFRRVLRLSALLKDLHLIWVNFNLHCPQLVPQRYKTWHFKA